MNQSRDGGRSQADHSTICCATQSAVGRRIAMNVEDLFFAGRMTKKT
jgi:hypothetical protein